MNNTPLVGQEFERARDQRAQDEIRQQVFNDLQDAHRIEAGTLDENQLSRRVNTSLAARGKNREQDDEKKKNTRDTLFMLSMLEQIRDDLAAMETVLADKYGEDFAEQLAADLLPPDKYDELIKIDDKEERRRAIAQAINDGIRDGTIDPNDPRINSDYQDWLDMQSELAREITMAEALTLPYQHETHAGIDNQNESSEWDAIFMPDKPF